VRDDSLIASICEENLNVYRASPTRLQEDVGQEAEIAHDYRGRLFYELLQNADDAMADNPAATADRRANSVSLLLTETELWVGNSGHPLRPGDVRGLCGIGASAKSGAVGRKRASIGHKGMGFKSVLEITDAPQVISETYSFKLGQQLAVEPVTKLMRDMGLPSPSHVPAMRFPAAIDDKPAEWAPANAAGIRTLFRFPLRKAFGPDQRHGLAARLLDLPATAILFLKHLERIDVRVATDQRSDAFRWDIERRLFRDDRWMHVPALTGTGMYRIRVVANHAEDNEFLVAHRDDLEIGTHRGGLEGYAWRGVELTEVSVAVPIEDDRPAELAQQARLLHVFLPTAEVCPYPMVINGAFSTGLSRQEVRVTPDPTDYNSWLLSQAAEAFVQHLAPRLRALGATDIHIVDLLDRGAAKPYDDATTPTGHVLVESMRRALAEHPIVATPTGQQLPVAEVVLPPLVAEPLAGSMFRSLLADDAEVDEALRFPIAELCGGRPAFILADHGAHILGVEHAPGILAATDLHDFGPELHPSELVLIDPVLRALEYMWRGMTYSDQIKFATAAREAELFPTDGELGGFRRVVVTDRACFYPPRALRGPIPLDNLCFLSRELCWGDLSAVQRNALLSSEMDSWHSIFGVRDFVFQEVMRSRVLPHLTLPDESGRSQGWKDMCRTDTLAAICQLSGPAPNSHQPLPFQRLRGNPALFRLARLPVPCRPDDSGALTWQPAYRVYFGEDWIGDASVEFITEAMRRIGYTPPDVPFLAGPDALVPLLQRYDHLRQYDDVDAESADDDDIDVDVDQPLETDHRERWLVFLTWLGVNHSLRPVHFSDAEDRGQGWLTTKGLTKPSGWAFRTLDADVWSYYVAAVRADREVARLQRTRSLYFYELHDLEFLAIVLNASTKDADCSIGTALLSHLALNWQRLAQFSELQIAAVPFEREPGRRSKPPTAQDDERFDVGENLWLHRLRQRPFMPTTHGPKLASEAWMPSPELDRRFSRRRLEVDALLPVVDVDDELASKAGPICNRLGVRDNVTASTFRVDDARTILGRIAKAFQPEAHTVFSLDRADVRDAIRPVYRNIIELLRGSDLDVALADDALATAPLLENNGHDDYRFTPGARALWIERNGTRERLGNPADLWTIVLESAAGLRLSLTRLFQLRVLEDHLVWEPEPGEDALEPAELTRFREGLQHLLPFILLRLSADRPAEDLQSRDAASLRRLIAALTPVRDLYVGCRLDGKILTSLDERSAFVDTRSDTNTIRAFVIGGPSGCPPTDDEAEALATAFAERLGASHFEAFIALISARDDTARRRLLTMAGAPSDTSLLLDAALDAGDSERGNSAQSDSTLTLPKEAAADTEETHASPSETAATAGGVRPTPLYSAADLIVSGTPVLVEGSDSRLPNSAQQDQRQLASPAPSAQNYGGRTDLSVLDRLGMSVAMTYELNRLLIDSPAARIFDPELDVDQPEACVFDISSPARIAVARNRSAACDRAMRFLATVGVNEMLVGCDILTLRSAHSPEDHGIDRMIELKSSGQHARMQSMTWNEWKSAANDRLRSRYYLYLVANLRSDIPEARPFLRAVRDPFAAIRAEQQIGRRTKREVALHVDEFDEAEYLEIGVRSAGAADAS
jgi:hypothetical protein